MYICAREREVFLYEGGYRKIDSRAVEQLTNSLLGRLEWGKVFFVTREGLEGSSEFSGVSCTVKKLKFLTACFDITGILVDAYTFLFSSLGVFLFLCES